MSEQQSASQQIRKLILPLYVPAILMALSAGVQLPVLPLFARDLGADYSVVGLVLAGRATGMLITDLPGGMALARLGGKRSMLLGTLIAGIAASSTSLADTVLTAFISQFFIGVGISLFGIARHAYVAEMVNPTIRGKAVGIIGGTSRLGGFIGPLIGGGIAAAYGLRVPFLMVGGFWVISFFVIMLFVPDVSVSAESVVTPAQYGRNMVQTWRSHWRILLSAGGGQMLAQLVRRGRGVLIPLFGADVLGLDVAQIGYVLSIAAGVDTLFFLSGGYIMDRFGRKFSIVPAFAIQGLGLLLIPFTTTFSMFAAAAALIGFGNSLSAGTMLTLGADLAPADERSTFLGSWRVVGSTGFSASPIIIGSIADIFSLPQAVIVIGVTGFLTSFVFARFVPETLKKEEST